MKRVLIMSDLHCGHRVGLTPPDWQYRPGVRSKWRKIQQACWNWYANEIEEAGPFDVVIVNGDAIDGRGERSGGTELLTTDRHEQVEIAAECIRLAQSKNTKTVIVRGTPYHVGQLEEYEDVLGREVGAVKVGNEEYVEIEGVTFNCVHHIGSSSIPHGKATPLIKAALWAEIWAARKEAPDSDVIVRSHVHSYFHFDDDEWEGFITPALQAMGSKFGAKKCQGTVTFGFLTFDVEDGGFIYRKHFQRLKATQPRKLTL